MSEKLQPSDKIEKELKRSTALIEIVQFLESDLKVE